MPTLNSITCSSMAGSFRNLYFIAILVNESLLFPSHLVCSSTKLCCRKTKRIKYHFFVASINLPYSSWVSFRVPQSFELILQSSRSMQVNNRMTWRWNNFNVELQASLELWNFFKLNWEFSFFWSCSTINNFLFNLKFTICKKLLTANYEIFGDSAA